MLLKEKKEIIKELQDINIITKPKRSAFVGQVQKLVIPEQIFNLKNHTVIVSGHITINRNFDNSACFECENKTSKIFYGIYDKENKRNFITFKEHLEIQKEIDKKIQL